MKVLIMGNTYRMNRMEFRRLLEVASEMVPRGIYAVESKEGAQLLCDHCASATEQKRKRLAYKRQGLTVYENRG